MQPGNVGISKDCIEMFPNMVDGHEYWNAWDIDEDGKPDILRVRIEKKDGASEFICFPAKTAPAKGGFAYEKILGKFKEIAETCDEGIDTRTARSREHLEKVNDVFFKARERALENLDLFQEAVLNKELIRGSGDRTKWNSVTFVGSNGKEMGIEIDEVEHQEAPWVGIYNTCYPDNTDITSIRLDAYAGMDVYVRDMNLLDGSVREWLEDYYRTSWASAAWMFNSECPQISYEWFSPFEYCKTHSDEICELEF